MHLLVYNKHLLFNMHGMNIVAQYSVPTSANANPMTWCQTPEYFILSNTTAENLKYRTIMIISCKILFKVTCTSSTGIHIICLSYVQEDENTGKTDGCYIAEVNT